MKIAYSNEIEKSTVVVAPDKVTKDGVKYFSANFSKSKENDFLVK